MFEQLPDEALTLGVAAIVTLVVIARLYVGEQAFRSDRGWFWNPIRRTVVPLLHRVFQRADDSLYAETDLRDREFVGIVDDYHENVRDQLLEAGYEFNPLASLGTDPNGNVETASLAWYHGDRPFHGAPEFLRPRQVHVRLFDVSDPVGPRTAVYAHEEATAWRPDLWRDHYRGESMDVQMGVDIATRDVGLAESLEEAFHPLSQETR